MNQGLARGYTRLSSESGALAIPTTGTVEFPHALGRVPFVQVTLLCQAADNGYAIGDEIRTELGVLRNSGATQQPFLTHTRSPTKIVVTRNAGAADVWKKDASAFGTLTSASWAIKIRCHV